MNEAILEKYEKAGRIAREARNFGKKMIRPGRSFLEVAEGVEKKIIEKGGGLAFPVNISVDEIAAHYTPRYDDRLVFKTGDVVKLDVGVHIDGYIADTAETIEVDSDINTELIETSEEALTRALETVKPGVKLREIGEVIETTIKTHGFKPVDNLTGHSLNRYELHSGKAVPNVSKSFELGRIEKDDVIAIEPFVTNGAGHVISGQGSNIYICVKNLKPKIFRVNRYKVFLDRLKKEFKTLPFSQRAARKVLSGNNEVILKKLSYQGMIKQYPQLVEQKKGIVAQSEHTVIIGENENVVIT